jgi:hypothetical protein
MWGVNPRLMCDRHLLGEHVEMHMFVGCIRKKMRLDGYLDGGLVKTDMIRRRHDKIAREFKRRGFRHTSPLGAFDCRYLGKPGYVDLSKNLRELSRRCRYCRRRIRK